MALGGQEERGAYSPALALRVDSQDVDIPYSVVKGRGPREAVLGAGIFCESDGTGGLAVLKSQEQGAAVKVLPGAVLGGEAVPGPAGVIGLAMQGVADCAVEPADCLKVCFACCSHCNRHRYRPFL